MPDATGNTQKFTLITEKEALKFNELIKYVDEINYKKDLARFIATLLDEWDELETNGGGQPVDALELTDTPSPLVGQGEPAATHV